MLHWQRLNFLDGLRRNCFNRFFITSFLLHLLTCFSLFFMYQNYQDRLTVSLDKSFSGAIVKVLPLSAPRSMLKNNKKSVNKSSFKKIGLIEQKKTKAIKKAKNSLHKIVSRSIKKKFSKKEAKKSEQQKINQKHAREPEKKEIVEKKDFEQVQSKELSGNQKQDILFVTQQEFDSLQLQKKLQESLFDIWAPPAGIPGNLVCEVIITIGWDGLIVHKEIIKKTGILIYDLSVQEALDKACFPHEIWGKKLTLLFKP